MTILAHIGGVDVGGVFAGGVHAIVARRTVAGYRTVIKLSVVPRVSVVAVLTRIATGDVVCGLTFGDGAVVARATRAKHSVVVDSGDVLEA